jgi:uncharacterized protein (UPF0332 family)
MAYADDLLQLSLEIANLHGSDAHQPSLRRALSTAYYALFHLLISDAISDCNDPQLRAALARLFEHGRMWQASDNKVSELKGPSRQRPAEGSEYFVQYHLRNVAETFREAQQNRNEADYNLTRQWRSTEVFRLIEGIKGAFESWSLIRQQRAARDYLIAMLPGRARRQQEKTGVS